MEIELDGKKIAIEKDLSAYELAIKNNLTAPNQAVAVSINGQLKDLSTPLKEKDQVIFYSFDDREGKDLFWHSSAHILAQAVLRLYPNAKPTIGPSIENGFYYDFADLPITDKDLPAIEKEALSIIKENLKTEREEFSSKEDALKIFKDNPYKCEMISALDPEASITGYRQKEFFDLCRGPHLHSLGKVKAFKLLKISGAYWRADSNNQMLTRIYGISFPEKKLLKEYLHLLEEAKKRDHKVLGKTLNLFSLKEEAPGMPFIHPKGLYIWNTLLDYLREEMGKAGYVEIKTPTMMSQQLWERSGHWEHYRENMYTCEVEDRQFAIKPMNCPGCMLYYKGTIQSYRDLPLRIAEVGNVYRFEPSGALNGLFRVRSFHQDDAHLFMQKEDIQKEILDILHFADNIYQTFGLTYRLELSTRPENSIGTDEEWSVATKGLQNALDQWGHDYRINEGDGAFYGPKIDIHIKDALGRHWQCGTLQLDMSLPEKFDLYYVDNNGEHKRPVMLHRALFGSIERFFGILIEHFAGKFPLWISPLPIRLLPVADRHVPFAKKVQKALQEAGFMVDIDATHESVGKKVRTAQLLKINYMLTVGDKELENNTISLRTRDNVVHGEISLDEFIKKLTIEKETKALMSPFSQELTEAL